MTKEELLEITEDEISRPDIDDLDEMEDYIRDYLQEEYGHRVKSFEFEFDMRKVYISNIRWILKS